jgi:hypothetical protein
MYEQKSANIGALALVTFCTLQLLQLLLGGAL